MRKTSGSRNSEGLEWAHPLVHGGNSDRREEDMGEPLTAVF